MPFYLKIINLFLLATVKFFFTPFSAFVLGLGLVETMLVTIAGGIFGFVSFYNLSYIIILSAQYLKPYVRMITPIRLRKRYRSWNIQRANNKMKRKKFSKRNRFIIKTRTTYGKWGIMLLMPLLLSIPIGAFLLRKYYSDQPNTLLYAVLVITLEGLVLSIIFWLVPLNIIFN